MATTYYCVKNHDEALNYACVKAYDTTRSFCITGHDGYDVDDYRATEDDIVVPPPFDDTIFDDESTDINDEYDEETDDPDYEEPIIDDIPPIDITTIEDGIVFDNLPEGTGSGFRGVCMTSLDNLYLLGTIGDDVNLHLYKVIVSVDALGVVGYSLYDSVDLGYQGIGTLYRGFNFVVTSDNESSLPSLLVGFTVYDEFFVNWFHVFTISQVALTILEHQAFNQNDGIGAGYALQNLVMSGDNTTYAPWQNIGSTTTCTPPTDPKCIDYYEAPLRYEIHRNLLSESTEVGELLNHRWRASGGELYDINNSFIGTSELYNQTMYRGGLGKVFWSDEHCLYFPESEYEHRLNLYGYDHLGQYNAVCVFSEQVLPMILPPTRKISGLAFSGTHWYSHPCKFKHLLAYLTPSGVCIVEKGKFTEVNLDGGDYGYTIMRRARKIIYIESSQLKFKDF